MFIDEEEIVLDADLVDVSPGNGVVRGPDAPKGFPITFYCEGSSWFVWLAPALIRDP